MQYDKRRAAAAMFLKDQNRRPPATVSRARNYGTANQMAYESQSKVDREELREKVGSAKKRAALAPRRRRAETGANSGTYGGSRSTLTSAFFGRK